MFIPHVYIDRIQFLSSLLEGLDGCSITPSIILRCQKSYPCHYEEIPLKHALYHHATASYG